MEYRPVAGRILHRFKVHLQISIMNTMNKSLEDILNRYDSLEPYPNIGHMKEYDRPRERGLLPSNPFISDQNKLRSSKGLRRLQNKAQVFTSPVNDHVRNRRSHTDEVVAISMTISERLGLNNNLCQAIALGHDIGHSPYGHLGEEMLTELGEKEFDHAVFGVVLCQYIESHGRGLNLTRETLEGILYHSVGNDDFIQDYMMNEYRVVQYADKIACLFSDFNDIPRTLLNGKIKDFKKIEDCAKKLGRCQNERITNIVKALLEESFEKRYVSFADSDEASCFMEFKRLMYENIYEGDVYNKVRNLHRANFRVIYSFVEDMFPDIDPVLATAVMTDKDMNDFGNRIVNSKAIDENMISEYSLGELISYIGKERGIDYTNPALDWKRNIIIGKIEDISSLVQ